MALYNTLLVWGRNKLSLRSVRHPEGPYIFLVVTESVCQYWFVWAQQLISYALSCPVHSLQVCNNYVSLYNIDMATYGRKKEFLPDARRLPEH